MSEQTYPLWICDACGDHAEVEPGDVCEVCVEGTIQVVQCVPLTQHSAGSVHHKDGPLAQLAQMADWAEDMADPARNAYWETAAKIAKNIRSALPFLAGGLPQEPSEGAVRYAVSQLSPLFTAEGEPVNPDDLVRYLARWLRHVDTPPATSPVPREPSEEARNAAYDAADATLPASEAVSDSWSYSWRRWSAAYLIDSPGPEDSMPEVCDSCGRSVGVIWAADNALWNLVIGGPEAAGDPGGVRCVRCFDAELTRLLGVRPLWSPGPIDGDPPTGLVAGADLPGLGGPSARIRRLLNDLAREPFLATPEVTDEASAICAELASREGTP